MRFHCWVLVLAGKREVAQGFFLEPTTGEPHPLDWEGYLGIESLWNGKNYWVNMQDCSQGVKVRRLQDRQTHMHLSTVDREIFAHKNIRLLNFWVVLFSLPRHTGSVASFLLFNVEKYSCF